MNARLLRFSLANGHRDVAQALADDLVPRIASQPGCQRATLFGDDSDGQYGIFVLWCCATHANEAAAVIQPILDQHLAGNVQAPPERRLFEVLSDSA